MMHTQRSDKMQSRIWFNFTLIGVATSSLFFIGAIRPSILQYNNFFTVQLTCAIPLLLSSAIAARRSLESKKPVWFEHYALYLGIVGYAFIVNAVGILLAVLANPIAVVFFFAINIINPLIYSYFRIIHDGSTIKERVYKDGLFIILIIVFGLAVALQ